MENQNKNSNGLFAAGKHRLCLAVFFLAVAAITVHQEKLQAKAALSEALVIEVNDGDTVTLRIDGKECRARLIGMDAPELGQRPWGDRAKDHLIALMYDAGWKVYVETDIVKNDKYERLLAYLWTKQKALINEQMILDGYAVLFTIPPNVRYTKRFTQAETVARHERKGIWGTNGLKEMPFEYRREHPRRDYPF